MRPEFILIAAAILPFVAFGVWCLFRRELTPVQWLLYWFAMLIVRFVWRTSVHGKLQLPSDSGAVLIANHRSSIDPCIIQLAVGPQIVHWMVAQIYGRRSIVGRMLDAWEIIPVGRKGNNVSAARTALRLAQEGRVVGMFPEGTVNTTDDFMLPVRSGAVKVAISARVPIIPCYVEGSPYHVDAWKPVFMISRVRLLVGEPIDLSDLYGREDDRELVEQVTLDCVREIAALADRTEFEPQLAGQGWKTWA